MARDTERLNENATALEREAAIRDDMAAQGGENPDELRRQAGSMRRQARGYRRRAR